MMADGSETLFGRIRLPMLADTYRFTYLLLIFGGLIVVNVSRCLKYFNLTFATFHRWARCIERRCRTGHYLSCGGGVRGEGRWRINDPTPSLAVIEGAGSVPPENPRLGDK